MCAKCGLSNRDHNVGYEIVIFTAIRVVFGNAHVYIQIASTTTAHTHCTPTAHTQCLASVDTGRHLNCVFNIFDNATISPTWRARRINNLTHSTASTARRSSHHLAKHALAHSANLARPATICAFFSRSSLFCSTAFAFVAANCRAHLYFCGATKHCFFKRNICDNFYILTARRTRLLTLTTTATKW